MRAFEVSLNGKRLCLAGVGDDGVLSAIVNWVTRKGTGDLFLEVGGLISPAHEHVSWETQRRLRMGDSIRVKVVDASSVDRPKKRKKSDPAVLLKARKRYVRKMAQQLGWKTVVQSKPKTND
jgi:hypothetical protein